MPLSMILSGCTSEPDKISFYKFARYDDYNTTASDVADSSSIYISGKLKSTEIMEIEDAPYLVAMIEERKNKDWIVVIGQGGLFSDDVLGDYIGKKVHCFGRYNGKKNGYPSIELSMTSDDYCINTTSNEIIASKDTLRATTDYAERWFEGNADEVIYSEAEKEGKTGSYKSTGIIQHLYGDDKAYFTLVQKKGNDYFESSVSEALGSDGLESLLNKYEEGDTIVVYFIIDEKGYDIPLCYDKAKVDFTLEEYENEAGSQLIGKKTYDWGNNGEVSLAMLEDPQVGSITIYASIQGDTETDALAAFFFYYAKFESLSSDIMVSAFVVGGEQAITYSRIDGREHVMGAERDGSPTLKFKMPDWASSNTDAADKASEMYEELNGFLMDFMNSIK